MTAGRTRTTAFRRWPVRPDLFELPYPDPRQYLERPTMFGLTLEQYRSEWFRRRDEGWQAWELACRLPAPVGVSA